MKSFTLIFVCFVLISGAQASPTLNSNGSLNPRSPFSQANDAVGAAALTIYGLFRLPLTLFESSREQRQLADVVRDLRKLPLDQWFVTCSTYQTDIYIDTVHQQLPALTFNSYNSNRKTLRIEHGTKAGTLYLDAQSSEVFDQIHTQCQEKQRAFLPVLQQSKLIGQFSLASGLVKITPIGARGFLDKSENHFLACRLLNKELVQIKRDPAAQYSPFKPLMAVTRGGYIDMIEDETLPAAKFLLCK